MKIHANKSLLAVSVLVVIFFSLVSFASAIPAEKVTLCHAAGQTGTTHFITLTIPYNAAFGQAGHFNEDGTPKAGHEDDYLGECITPPTTTTEAPSSTTTSLVTTTTETPATTTSPPTTVPPSSTTTVVTTLPPTTTTTTPHIDLAPDPDPVPGTPKFTG